MALFNEETDKHYTICGTRAFYDLLQDLKNAKDGTEEHELYLSLYHVLMDVIHRRFVGKKRRPRPDLIAQFHCKWIREVVVDDTHVLRYFTRDDAGIHLTILVEIALAEQKKKKKRFGLLKKNKEK